MLQPITHRLLASGYQRLRASLCQRLCAEAALWRTVATCLCSRRTERVLQARHPGLAADREGRRVVALFPALPKPGL